MYFNGEHEIVINGVRNTPDNDIRSQDFKDIQNLKYSSIIFEVNVVQTLETKLIS